MSKRGLRHKDSEEKVWWLDLVLTMRHPAERGRELNVGGTVERENLWLKEKKISHRGGAIRSSEEASVMGAERRGCPIRLH